MSDAPNPIRRGLEDVFARHATPLSEELAKELQGIVQDAYGHGFEASQLVPVEVGDVVQLDPQRTPWGPLFAILDKVEGEVARGYFFMPANRGETPGVAYIRLMEGDYRRVGRADWIVQGGQDADVG